MTGLKNLLGRTVRVDMKGCFLEHCHVEVPHSCSGEGLELHEITFWLNFV